MIIMIITQMNSRQHGLIRSQFIVIVIIIISVISTKIPDSTASLEVKSGRAQPPPALSASHLFVTIIITIIITTIIIIINTIIIMIHTIIIDIIKMRQLKEAHALQMPSMAN